jgi:hypothetical protein
MADVSIKIDVKEFTPAEALIAMGPDPSVIEEILLKAYAGSTSNPPFNHEHVLVRCGTSKYDNSEYNSLSTELENYKLKRGLIYIETYNVPDGILKDILYPVYERSIESGLNYYKHLPDHNTICYVYEDTTGIEIINSGMKLRKFYIWYSSDIGFSLDMTGLSTFETFVGVKF